MDGFLDEREDGGVELWDMGADWRGEEVRGRGKLRLCCRRLPSFFFI